MEMFKIESWSWYSACWIAVIFRLVSRRMLLGSFKSYQLDDYLIVLAMITETVMVVTINIVAITHTNMINLAEPIDLSPQDIAERVYGSKMALVVEEMQIATTWLVKTCWLIMYGRLTMSLKQNAAIKYVAGYVVFGFVLMEVLYLGVWCRPFNQYWAVPTENIQCSASINHLRLNAFINVSSDMLIMSIPLLLLIKSQLPFKKRMILVILFFLSAATIALAVLNKYYGFRDPFSSRWTFWYIRESGTALITANLPFAWGFLLRMTSSTRPAREEIVEPPTSSHSQNTIRNSDNIFADLKMFSESDDRLSLALSDFGEQLHQVDSIRLRIFQQHEIHVVSQPLQRQSYQTALTVDSAGDRLSMTRVSIEEFISGRGNRSSAATLPLALPTAAITTICERV